MIEQTDEESYIFLKHERNIDVCFRYDFSNYKDTPEGIWFIGHWINLGQVTPWIVCADTIFIRSDDMDKWLMFMDGSDLRTGKWEKIKE